MPIFTAIAAGATALATAVGFGAAAAASIGAFVVRTMVTIGISKLVANRANKSSAGASDVGARVQLGPATNNKLSVSYGSAFLAPTVTDAKITTDQKTMYYVFTLCEATSGTLSFGKIFWNGKEVTLGVGEYSANNKVISLTNNATPPQVDTTIDGQAFIYGFINGSSSGVNTGGTSAITILQDAGIPVADRWTSTDTMTNTCFAIVKVIYNKDVQDAQQMPRLSVEIINTLTKPGEVLLDYMTDTVYGCAIDVTNIDTASLTALDAYSDQTITYIPVGGGTTTQPRYRIDGPVNTGDNCLSNLQQLVDACDSWLQYSELTGQWTIVINKPYTGTLSSLYSVDSSVLIGGIDINPIDLNQTYNSLEVQYPNANINDQTDYKVVDLTTVGTAWYNPSLLSPNEPDNRLTIQYPQINNYIRAVYLGVRRLLQSREDLTIVCNLDYSGIQVVAGDVVRVTLAEYGWADKLFRVSQVQETKTGEGFLGARITAFEYNATVYADNALDDFIPDADIGISNPNIISAPGTPSVTTNPLTDGNVKSFTVTSTVPSTGSVLYMDFNYGTSNSIATHRLYKTVSQADGTLYTAGASVNINVNDLPPATYYWSVTARNEQAGRSGASSTGFVWAGPGVTTYDPGTNTGGITNSNIVAATILGTSIAASTIGYNNLAPSAGAAQIIGFADFQIGPPTPTPIDYTTGTYNYPGYLDGTTVLSTKYFPFFQGTSSTADGFNANSTGILTPVAARGWQIYNGQNNWWIYLYTAFTETVDAATEYIRFLMNVTLVSDTNTTVQVVSFLTYVGSPTVLRSDTLGTTTVELKANLPQTLVLTGSSGAAPGVVYEASGYVIRNMISGTRVYAVEGEIEISKSKF
jgi:hypothetical protein